MLCRLALVELVAQQSVQQLAEKQEGPVGNPPYQMQAITVF